MQQTRKNVTAVSTALAALTAAEVYARTKSAGRIELWPSQDATSSGSYRDWAIGDRPAAFTPEAIGIIGDTDTFVLVNFVAGVPNRGKRKPPAVVLGYVINGKADVGQGLVEQFADTVMAAMNQTGKPIYRNATGNGPLDITYALWSKSAGLEPLSEALEMEAINSLDIDVWNDDAKIVAVGTNNKAASARYVSVTANAYNLAMQKTELHGVPLAVAIGKNGTVARIFKDGDTGTVLEVKPADKDHYQVVAPDANPTTVRIRTTDDDATYVYAYDPKGGVLYMAKVGDTAVMTINKPVGAGNFHGIADNDGLAYLVFEGLTNTGETDGSTDEANPAAWTLVAPEFTSQAAAQQ